MGYLFAFLSVISGTTKGFFGKKIGNFTKSINDAMLFNSIRMMFCVVIGFFISLLSGGISALAINPADITSILLSGLFSALFVVTWLISVKSGAYLMLDVFLLLGVIVPLIGSNIFLKESISLKQCLGIAVLIAALPILCSYNNKIKEKLTISSFGLLILCGLTCGLSDFSQKIFAVKKTGTLISTFNLYSFLISFAILFFGFLFTKKHDKGEAQLALSTKATVYVLITSVCMFLNSYFQTIAATYLSSTELFPLTKGFALILSTIMAGILFKEKVNLKCIMGVILAFAGILIINL